MVKRKNGTFKASESEKACRVCAHRWYGAVTPKSGFAAWFCRHSAGGVRMIGSDAELSLASGCELWED